MQQVTGENRWVTLLRLALYALQLRWWIVSAKWHQFWHTWLWFRLAWLMPRKLVAMCGVRVWAHATMGKYSNQEAGSITIAEALQRWDKPNAETEDAGD